MTRKARVELLGWDKGPLCWSWSHRISWMGLQLCRTNIYPVSSSLNIRSSGDKNRQGDWKVRYTCTTFLPYLGIYIRSFSDQSSGNTAVKGAHDVYLFLDSMGFNPGLLECMMKIFFIVWLKCNISVKRVNCVLICKILYFNIFFV